MSIAQKSIAVIAILAVVAAVFASFVATIQVAQAAVCPGTTFSANLKMGSKGASVMALQQFLNMDPATQVAASGAGSPGMETSSFGGLTKAAVIKFQNKYASEVLAPAGLTAGNGNFFAYSRAKANALCAGSTSTPTPAPGTGLSVAAGSQPANSLAPQGATRVPFTRFTLTAGSDGAVTVSGIVIQRVGLGSDAAFAGVVLLDQDGNQLGNAKTFNSNHQATVGESMTIPAGQSRTFTVAGNMNSSLLSYAGEAPAIAVVGVNTTATVSGSLPIQGAFHTMNSTLVVGSLSLDVSNAFAANTPGSKELGTTAQRVSGFSVTAGSAEDVRLKMIRFNQTGSASAGDLSNVKVMVETTAYPMTVSADGKYYTANLGSGILIPKGNRVEIYVVYDIVGSSSSGRTIIFDVDKTTDIYAEGATYGYGISPAAGTTSTVGLTRTGSNTTETSGTPYIYGNQITVTGASVTTIQKSNTVAAQNIAINVPNQPLGAFEVDIKGEAITVQQMTFQVATTSGASRLTNVTLVDENGSVVAGPVDLPASASNGGSLTFTDTVTFKTGKKVYKLLGKVDSNASNNATYVVSTNPSTWTNVRGETTGNTITISQTSFSLNTMTIRAGSVSVGRASSPASQTMTPGGTSVLMVNYQFDASQSGEDIRFASVPVQLIGGGSFAGDESMLTSCQIFDGSNALNTGSNSLNPSSSTATSSNPFFSGTITLDNPVTVAKGTVKTVGMRCNIASGAHNNSTFIWDTQAASAFTFTGATSGTSITGSDSSDAAITVTIGAGSTTVTTDASSPSYSLVAAGGASEVTIGALKFRATNEAVNLQRIGLALTNAASSAPGDLVKVSIYDGAVKVGEATFVGSQTTGTSTLMSSVLLPKDTDKTLTVKAQLASIGTSQAVTFSGHLLAIDVDTNSTNTQGTGVDSGNTINVTGSSAVAGVRILKSYPTLALDTLSSTGVNDGRLMRFKVTADAAGPISLTEFNFLFATTSVTLSNVSVYGFTDSGYSQPISGVQTGGLWAAANSMSAWASSATNIEFVANNGSADTAVQVPAGQTRYFEVRGSVAGVVSGSSVTTTLRGSTAFVGCGASGATVNPLCQAAAAGLGNALIWSPNTTTTPVRTDLDWTGGFGVPGLPSNGLIQTRGN